MAKGRGGCLSFVGVGEGLELFGCGGLGIVDWLNFNGICGNVVMRPCLMLG
jgi:hypothetical protein